MIPLPLVGDEATEYVAWKRCARDRSARGADVFGAGDIAGGVTPSAENSPEKTTTPNAAGLAVKPAYVPFSALLLKEPAAWGSPNPNKTLASETNRKT